MNALSELRAPVEQLATLTRDPWLLDSSAGPVVCARIQAMLAGEVRQPEPRPQTLAVSLLQAGDGPAQRKIAVLPIQGVLTRSGIYDGPNSSTYLLNQAMTILGQDPTIAGIVLDCDSPGGSSRGVAELADTVYTVAQSKPVVARVDGLAASAMYWIASSASVVMAGRPETEVGSIGAFTLLFDLSEALKEWKIEAVLIRSKAEREDNMKGLGVFGTKITDEQRAYLQERINDLHEDFALGIVRGRNVARADLDKYENGRVFSAKSLDDGVLVDRIGSMQDAMNLAAGGRVAANQARHTPLQLGETKMSSPTIADARTRYPDADAGWILDKLASGTTTDALDKEYMAMLGARAKQAEGKIAESTSQIEGFKAEIAKLTAGKAEAEAKASAADASLATAQKEITELKAKLAMPGSDHNVNGGADPGQSDAKTQVDAKVAELTKTGVPVHEAYARVFRDNPDLRAKYGAQ